MIDDNLIFKLKERLSKPLPGELAQKSMMAVPENKLRFDYSARSGARESGVLILFYRDASNWLMPLILRPEYNGAHSGQVAFPGGRREEEDEGIVHTALREAREEIGINDKDVTILGQLTELFIPVSNYIVYPVLGYMNYQPKLIPEEREVKQVLEVNLSHLLEAERIKRKKIEIRGYTIDTPYFDLENQFVWGATAMILSELKELIGEVMPQSSK